MEQELYKIRSASACIKSAYTLFGSNLKTIFRRLWIPSLVFAFIMAAIVWTSSFTRSTLLSSLSASSPHGAAASGKALALGILQNSLTVLMAIAIVWLIASLVTMLNKFGFKRNLLQTAKIAILQLVIYLIMAIVIAIPIVVAMLYQMKANQPAEGADALHATAATQQATALQTIFSPTVLGAIGLAILLCLVFELLLLPIYYFYMKYLMEPIHMRSHLWKSFKTGLRHWGFLFLTFFMMGLLLLCLFVVLFMPLGILSTAQSQSLAGVLMGDPSGLPSHMLLLQFVTALVTFFIFAFILAWSVLVLYHAYGSIEQKEIERKAHSSLENQL